MRRLAIIPLLIALGAVTALLARPLRWEVDGLSMAPGLLPGDLVCSRAFPLIDFLRQPRRFDRLIVRPPDGSLGIKRLVGLPGERLSIADGDLAIDGEAILTPPRILAEIASRVPFREDRRSDGSVRLVIDHPPLDDAPFAPRERRVLLPVRDIGLAAVIQTPTEGACLRLAVGSRAVRLSPQGPGRFMLVAGRLDGRFVAAAWPLDEADRLPAGPRNAFLGAPPAAWQLIRPWGASEPVETPFALECREETPPQSGKTSLEQVFAWRDILHRPGADGVVEWRLGPRDFFMLGDFPSGSLDSRHWGPISADRILQRRLACLTEIHGVGP